MDTNTVKKVVVIGPESTGKSTLTAQLAHHFNTIACPEYAREYLMQNGTNYTYNDLLTIAKGQLALENEKASQVSSKWPILKNTGITKHPVLFIDTDMYVMKVWCEYVFEKCHFEILEAIATRKYDLYLLCNIDLPWVKDDLREYPDEQPRRELYHIYSDLLINQPVPWVSISGNYQQRLQTAIDAVKKYV